MDNEQTPEVNAIPPAEQTPVPQAGNPEDLKAKVEELERRNQGILRDLQQERERRKALETQRSIPSPAGNPVVASADVDPVDQLLRTKFGEMVQPLAAEVEQLRAEKEMQKAFKFLAKAEKLDVDDVPASPVFQELISIANELGIRGASPEAEAKAAYEILQKRRSDKVAAEKASAASREAAIKQQSSETSRGVPGTDASKTRVVTREVIGKMTSDAYRQMLADAQANGIRIRVE